MDFESMSEQEVMRRFNELIASTEQTSGAPAHWFAIQSLEEKRALLAEIYRPKLPRYQPPAMARQGGPYTPWPPQETTTGSEHDDNEMRIG